MRSSRLTFLAFAAFLGIGLACSFGDEGGGGEWGEGPPRASIRRATVVEVSPAAAGSVADVLTSSATVQSEAEANLFPAATGTVKEVRVEEGDPVRRDQVLAVIDNATLQAGSTRASAEVERLAADVARLEELFARGAVSERELSDARYSLETARTSAWEAGRSSGQTRIKSPIDGIVSVREIRVGELATSGARAFQVVDLARLRVIAALPERDLARVTPGQPVKLVSAYDTDVFTQGTVTRVAPVVDPTSGTFRVTVDLDPEQATLRPGQFVTVEIEVDRHDDVLVVPRQAIVWEDGTSVVYRMIDAPEDEDTGDADAEPVADEDTDGDTEGPQFVAERVVVELGLVDEISAEILTGIETGDPIVTVGQTNLRDGAPIRAVTDEENG